MGMWKDEIKDRKDVITIFESPAVVIKISGGQVFLFDKPDRWYPGRRTQLFNVLVEHYPEDQTLGIYGCQRQGCLAGYYPPVISRS